MSKVVLVESHVYENFGPIASGYLQAYASKTANAAGSHRFKIYRCLCSDPLAKVLDDLRELDADVYAFSAYMWNIRQLAGAARVLASEKPGAHIILGGHQAANHAHRYLDSERANMYVCNGEGEITFSEFLKAVHEPGRDVDSVKGLSFYRDGELVTTEPQKKMRCVDDIPSPYLTGVFDDLVIEATVLETNRGCPFQCSFCTWGGAGQSVFRFDERRVRAEIESIARRGVHHVWIADANWGMLPRDVEFSKFFVECQAEYGFPKVVTYAAAKNNPGRSAECAEILSSGGLLTCNSIGMQSMSDAALSAVKRSNIKNSRFRVLQDHLSERKISSIVEMMWPLPRETLSSFKAGISHLCKVGDSSVVLYPVMLINNADMTARRDEYGLVTEFADDPAAEAELVVASADVSRKECRDGWWFFFAAFAAFNTRTLTLLSRHLERTGVASHQQLIEPLADLLERDDNPISNYLRSQFETFGYYDNNFLGHYLFTLVHEHRAEWIQLVSRFARTQSWWEDDEARVLLELGLLNIPCVFHETVRTAQQVACDSSVFSHFHPSRGAERQGPGFTYHLLQADLPQRWSSLVAPHATVTRGGVDASAVSITVDHLTHQVPLSESSDQNDMMCHGMLEHWTAMMPSLRHDPPDPVRPAASLELSASPPG